MQNPAPHAAQTYSVVAITNIDAKCREYDKLAKEIVAAQTPAQGFQKALPPNMVQQKIARKAQLELEIKHDLDTDIDAIHRNNERYKQGLETMRGMAKTRLDHAKAAVAVYQKSKRANDLQEAVHETASVGRDIQLLLETAEQENRNFGRSWFDYRTFNPLTIAKTLPPATAEDFLTNRTGLINDGKMVTASLKKFQELVPQAMALNKMSSTLAAGGRQDANTAIAHANQLAAKIDTEVDDILTGSTNLKQNWHFTKTKYEALHADAINANKNKKADLKVAEDRYADGLAAVKVLKNKIKSTKVQLDAEVKSFTKDERELPIVKAQLKHSKDKFATLDPIVKLIATAEAQGIKDIALMRQRCTH